MGSRGNKGMSRNLKCDLCRKTYAMQHSLSAHTKSCKDFHKAQESNQ